MFFYDLLLSILLAAVLFASAGFIVYKKGHAKSWEQGIEVFMLMILKYMRFLFDGLKKCFRSLSKFAGKAFRWWQRNDLAYLAPNESLALAPNEVTALVKALSVRPYITPARKRVGVDNGVWYLEIKSLGMQERYSAMSPAEIREMVGNIFSEMLMEERGEVPSFYISVATAHRFLLHIPLSQYGFDFLQRKIPEFEEKWDNALPSKVIEAQPLTEEVPDLLERDGAGCGWDT